MGQYYLVVNLDKKEYINPHKFGDGAKLMEFASSGGGTMLALGILLADGNGLGGGDLQDVEDLPIVGSWAGNRIVIVGDYAETKYRGIKAPLYDTAKANFVDVSARVWEAILRDPVEREITARRIKEENFLYALEDFIKPNSPLYDEYLNKVFRSLCSETNIPYIKLLET